MKLGCDVLMNGITFQSKLLALLNFILKIERTVFRNHSCAN